MFYKSTKEILNDVRKTYNKKKNHTPKYRHYSI
jgi:hypothetical protein